MALETITLLSLRTQAKDMADMQNTSFVSDAEWDRYINQGVRELYDLLLAAHGQEYFLKTFEITLTPPTNVYTLPDDLLAIKGVDFSTTTFPDLDDGSPVLTDTRWSTIDQHVGDTDVVEILPYMFADRHTPSTTSNWRQGRAHRTMRYRMYSEQQEVYSDDLGPDEWLPNGWYNRIRFDPVESGFALVWYTPQADLLSGDSDEFPFWHGWQLYPAMFAAKIALEKEESDSRMLTMNLQRMRNRLEEMAHARDVGHPEIVQDTNWDLY